MQGAYALRANTAMGASTQDGEGTQEESLEDFYEVGMVEEKRETRAMSGRGGRSGKRRA